MTGHIYATLPRNAKVRIPDPWSGDSQDQETFLAPSAKPATLIQSAQTTITLNCDKAMGLSHSKIK